MFKGLSSPDLDAVISELSCPRLARWGLPHWKVEYLCCKAELISPAEVQSSFSWVQHHAYINCSAFGLKLAHGHLVWSTSLCLLPKCSVYLFQILLFASEFKQYIFLWDPWCFSLTFELENCSLCMRQKGDDIGNSHAVEAKRWCF